MVSSYRECGVNINLKVFEEFRYIVWNIEWQDLPQFQVRCMSKRLLDSDLCEKILKLFT